MRIAIGLHPFRRSAALEGLRVGRARATLRFTRGRTAAFAEVLEIEGGELKVRIEV